MSSVAIRPVNTPGYPMDQDLLSTDPAPSQGSQSALQEKINQMQSSRLGSRRLPTVPALGRILPGGGLMAGGTYTVENSTTLAMALLAGPSGSGAWCAVIGIPDFNVEAAAHLGIELDRLILIPHLDGQWLTVTAAMMDVVSIILTKTPATITGSDASRLKARLRQRGAALISIGSWPQSEAVLSVSDNRWGGLGSGSGHLQSRQLKITATANNGHARSVDLSLAELKHGGWPQLNGTANNRDVHRFVPRMVSA
ncbi:hypothetical protein [Arthrobacter sp. CAN_C5]|uniref:hypothetical protein n=1 Tax=Arthrobacter sp. CAN_C5 TaxID=2760706 RepID=UPI0028AC29C6|nr:hypothetical protein [Arthrobacter sp. CAN_C5]MBP2218522.1 hypothetical protein [Arthrobacter sp. CAN_C5]